METVPSLAGSCSRASLLLALAMTGSLSIAADEDVSTQNDRNNESATALPPIIITAPQWQPVDALRLPTTVNVMSAKKLDEAGVNESSALQYLTPGLVFKKNAVFGQPYLRGVGSDLISAGADPGVSTYADGVYQARSAGAIQNFFDVERVEVLKGPQGVHLGRNALGGAISVITKDPEFYRSADADLLYGSYDQRQFRGVVNTPIEGTDLAFRLAGLISKRDGYTENIFLDRELDDEDLYALRGKLRYAPSDDLDLLFTVETSHEDDSRGLGQQPDLEAGINGGILLGGTVPDDPREVTHNIAQSAKVDYTRYSAKLSSDLGGVNFLSTTAYQESDISMMLDLDSTEIDFSMNEPEERSNVFTQEFRLTSNRDHAFGWIAGLYYLHEDAAKIQDIQLPLFGVRNRADGDVETDAYAAFGELSYRFAPDWEATAGIRYSHDRRQFELAQTIQDPLGMVGPPGTIQIMQEDDKSWDAVTPELALTYIPSENELLYAKASRGFKSGGFNTSAAQPSFDPEFLWAYEIGYKAARRVGGINGSLFYYDYDDIQLLTLPVGAPVGAYPIVINAAKATVKGMDLDGWLKPTPRLTLSLGLTLLDARFDDFVAIDPNNPTDDPDRSGDKLPQAPDVSLNLGARYSWPVDGYGKATLSGEYRYQSAVYFNPANDPAVRQDAYGLVNASLVFESHGDPWYAELYGRNLTDELYAENIIRLDPLIGTIYFWGAPRTFGLRVGYRW